MQQTDNPQIGTPQKQCIHSKLEIKTDLNKNIKKIAQDIEYIELQHDKLDGNHCSKRRG